MKQPILDSDFLKSNSLSETVIERFWEKVHIPKDPELSCWLWTGGKFGAGYGAIMRGSEHDGVIGAHVLSWILHFGSVPRGLFVCHLCDKNYPWGDKTYKLCVRPDHLWVGTASQNNSDMAQKMRSSFGFHHHKVKLNALSVLTIRRDHDFGKSVPVLMMEHRVSEGAIRKAISGENWGWLK
jgi:hypothetical protein